MELIEVPEDVQVEECIEIIRPALQADGGDIELKDCGRRRRKSLLQFGDLRGGGRALAQ